MMLWMKGRKKGGYFARGSMAYERSHVSGKTRTRTQVTKFLDMLFPFCYHNLFSAYPLVVHLCTCPYNQESILIA
jgi:hypothetical protein